jgi:hypothetical protein
MPCHDIEGRRQNKLGLFGSNSMHGYAERSNRQSRVEAGLALWISDQTHPAAQMTSLSFLLFQNGLRM